MTQTPEASPEGSELGKGLGLGLGLGKGGRLRISIMVSFYF